MVSFETAKAMKEAGFPQPTTSEIQTGQFWYSPKGYLCCVTYNKAQWSFRVAFLDYPNKYAHLVEDAFVYAPTATDMLTVLGVEYTVGFSDGVFNLHWGREMEVVASGANITQAMGAHYVASRKAYLERLSRAKPA